MKELEEYRRRLIQRLGDAAHEFRAACLATAEPYAPIESGGWNTHQLAVHTRDVDRLVYGMRARRTAEEQDPLFENFDGDAYMTDHYDSKEPLSAVLDDLVAGTESLGGFLGGLPPGAWARESSHATNGRGFTLQTWVERGLGHIEEHLATVRKMG